jgi:hypothetical protein
VSDEGVRLAQLVDDLAERHRRGGTPMPIVTPADAITITNALHDEMDAATAARAQVAVERELKIACEPGCSACCENTIIVLEPEAIVVADYLSRPENRQARASFVRGYKHWKNRIGDRLGDLALHQVAGDLEAYEALLAKFWRERIMCALNHDSECVAYPVRPNVCRGCHALDTNVHCRGDDPSGEQPTVLQFQPLDDFTTRIRPLLQAVHVAVRGYRAGPAPLCSTLYRLLESSNVPEARVQQSRDGHQAKGGKIGRNAPCPCGSGKKYKRCCGG